MVGSNLVVAAAQVLDERVPSDHDIRGVVGLQPAHRAELGFQPAVIALDSVVPILLSVVERGGKRLVDDLAVLVHRPIHIPQRPATLT